MIKKIIGALFLLISLQNFAQRNNTSPYSFFGIGDASDNKTVEELAMGEIGGAFNSTFQLSLTNPASYAHLRYTNFALAGVNQALQLNDGTNKDSGSNASLSYIALSFPIGLKSGFAFGLTPSSSVGYSLTQEILDDNGELTTINVFSGEGGTNKVFLGYGRFITKNLSLGAEASYTFGSIENNLLNRRDNVPLATLQKVDTDIRSVSLAVKLGAQYVTKISEKLTLKTGAVVDLSDELSNKGNQYIFSLENRPDGVISPRDTTFSGPIDVRFRNPLKTIISAGVGEENKWYAGVEYEFQNALEFNDGLAENNATFGFENSSRISMGGFYTPKINSVTNYWQRLTYRAGLKYEETGLIVNNTTINNFGISFGVGFPIGRQLSNLNLGIELGQRGETTNNLVRENYFNFRLGLSLSDRWFIKRKLD